MSREDILELAQHYIVSDLWIYKHYQEIIKILLTVYKLINKCTNTELYKISFEIWSLAKNTMYERPSFEQWCIDMETL